MKHLLFFFTAALLVAANPGCGRSDGSSKSANPLVGTWQLSSTTGSHPVPDAAPTLTFHNDNTFAYAPNGLTGLLCDRTGTYEAGADGNTLVLTTTSSTACSLSNISTRQTYSYVISGTTLTLTLDQTNITDTYVRM